MEGTTFLVCVVWDLDFRASCFVHRDQPDCENALVLGRFIANTSGKVKSLYDGTREGKPYELVSGLQVRSEATIAGVWC